MPTWDETLAVWRTPAHAEHFAQRVDAFPCCYWECSYSQVGDEPFEDVLLPAKLRSTPNPRPFARHLLAPVNTFDNLRGDALMVVPAPVEDRPFAHLAQFTRHAPHALQVELWNAIADAIEHWWANAWGPLWVSTHGAGVAWLHVRLDSKPKYYHSPLDAGPPHAGR
jgi:hypothetical protein